jgi:hypothetical protein
VEILMHHSDITFVALLVAIVGASPPVIGEGTDIGDVSTLPGYYFWPFFLRRLVLAAGLRFAIKQAAQFSLDVTWM